ncbi:MAG: tetratricopeptide repeat protein [Acidobacteria bacterium]|nr:tetratricopeptide repeat protein [Acidobacteriota bacterium]
MGRTMNGVAAVWLVVVALTGSIAASPGAPPAAVLPAPGSAGHADSYYYYCLFQQSLMQRDYGRALSFLEKAADADPNAPLLAMELGRAYLGMDELDRAESQARRAATLAPDSVEARRLLAEIYKQYVAHADDIDDSLFARASAAFADLVAADPTDGETRIALARLYLSKGLFMQATEILRAQIASDPNSVDAYFLLGESLIRTRQTDEARKLLGDAARQHPENPDLQRALGDAFEASGDLDAALGIRRALAVAHSDRPSLRFQLARLLLRMKRSDEAAVEAEGLLVSLRGATADDDRDVDQRATYMLLIEAHSDGGRLEEAVKACDRAEKEFPTEARFTLKKAELLLLTGREGDAEALIKAVATRGGADGPGKPEASEVFFRAGATKERDGDIAAAEHFLRRSIEADPTNHAALNYLGFLLADRGEKLQESLAMIQRALSLDEGNGAYLDSLGWALYRLRRYDEAEAPLRAAARAIPDEAVVQDHLGDLYWAVGRKDEAVRAWEAAIRIGIADPDSLKKKISRAGATATPGP